MPHASAHLPDHKLPVAIERLATLVARGRVTADRLRVTLSIFTYNKEWKDVYHEGLPNALTVFRAACASVGFESEARDMLIGRAMKGTIKAEDLESLLKA